MTRTAQHYPAIFDVTDEQSAKNIILTEEGPGADTDTRWAKETPHVLALIRQNLALRPDMLVLDYGCGIGRMSKAMIEATGCSVIGVDISPSMRSLAVDYVGSDRFLAVSPGQFDMLVAAGARVQAAISVWVLQHCLAPAQDIERVRGSLAGGAGFVVLNMPKRAVPVLMEDGGQTSFQWASDGMDVAALLRSAFHVTAEGDPTDPSLPNMADAGAFWMSLILAPS